MPLKRNRALTFSKRFDLSIPCSSAQLVITTIEAQEVEKPALSAAGSLDEKFTPELNDEDEHPGYSELSVPLTSRRNLTTNRSGSSFLPYYAQNIINTHPAAGPAHSTTMCRNLFYTISVGPSHSCLITCLCRL